MPCLRRLFAILLLSVAVALPAAAKPATEKPVTDKPLVAEAPLVVFNRTVFVFRSEFFGLPPSARAARAGVTLEAILDKGGEQAVTIKDNPEGQFILVGGTLVFGITPEDVDPLTQETLQQAATRAAQALAAVIAETREARSIEALLKAIGFSLLATAIFALLLWGLARLHERAQTYFMGLAARKAEALRIGGTQIVESHHLIPALRRLLALLHWLVVALLAYEWLSFVLSRFPYTRPWGERLNDYFLRMCRRHRRRHRRRHPRARRGDRHFPARALLRRISSVASSSAWRAAAPRRPVAWAPTPCPPRAGCSTSASGSSPSPWPIPTCPAPQTDAFKGLSVLLGLMVSLGASSVVGQAAAGLILTYTRTLQRRRIRSHRRQRGHGHPHGRLHDDHPHRPRRGTDHPQLR